MKRATPYLLLLLIMPGCHSNPAAPATSSASPAVAPALPATPLRPPMPEWAVNINKAADCVDKSKAEVVAAFGEPKVANNMFGAAKVYRYSVGDAPVEGGLLGGGAGDVEYLEFGFPDGKTTASVTRAFKRDKRLSTETAWSAMELKESAPEFVLTSKEAMERFWLNQDSFKVQTQPGVVPPSPETIEFPLTFRGELKNGKTILFRAAASAPPLRAEVGFNPNMDRRELGELAPDLGFDWKACSVYGIRVVSQYEAVTGEQAYSIP